MTRILIVEDDEHIAKMIEAVLSIGGYQGVICGDGNQALEKLLTEYFDLALLDVMLPGLDGFEILEKLSGREIPVIFLTARQDVADKVKGLRLGAEDYIVKPFEAMELLARIEVVLRRVSKSGDADMLCYEDIQVDMQRHLVKKGEQEISLTPREFDVMVFFLQHPDIALTRERLLSAIWGYSFEGESRTVDIHVQQVRRKLGLQGKLVTIPKLGWRLEKR